LWCNGTSHIPRKSSAPYLSLHRRAAQIGVVRALRFGGQLRKFAIYVRFDLARNHVGSVSRLDCGGLLGALAGGALDFLGGRLNTWLSVHG
jgi:hypothetical protein